MAYNEISCCTQRVQEEILKRCDRSLERLDDLVKEAQEGVFDIRRCAAAFGCKLINDVVPGGCRTPSPPRSALARERQYRPYCATPRRLFGVRWRALTADQAMPPKIAVAEGDACSSQM
jgi:hypothetical protein